MRILWKRRLSYDKLMKLITQEVSTAWSTMSIIDPEKWALRPFLIILWSIGRLHYVENNRYAILIITSYDALMCVHCIPCYFPVTSHWALSGRSIYPLTFLLELLRTIGIKRDDYFMSRLKRYGIKSRLLICLCPLLRYRLRVFPLRHLTLFSIIRNRLCFQCTHSVPSYVIRFQSRSTCSLGTGILLIFLH
jgi:hypothetical protein